MGIKIRKTVIPEWVELYLEARKPDWKSPASYFNNRQKLKNFHHWLKLNGVDIRELGRKDVERFLRYPSVYHPERPAPPTVSLQLRKALGRYFHWLIQEKKLRKPLESIVPGYSLPRRLQKLPNEGEEFLRLEKATLSSSTVTQYRSTLVRFYEFLKKEGIAPKDITRRHVERLMAQVSELPVSNNFRRKIYLEVRVYFRWLDENGYITTPADKLIKTSDIPRLHELLPRPLPAPIDRTIQERLEKSDDIYSRGLLLMRWTGLRISELVNLTFDCLKEDHSGSSFLKVELGKLKNERLVPIDDKTRRLILTMQKQTLEHAKECRLKTRPKKLLFDIYQRQGLVFLLRRRLREISGDIPSESKIVAHRLRHTYATELLNAGMSLPALMRCMGHRDIKMTLRYAMVTQETIRREYQSAVEQIEKRYQMPLASSVRDGQDQLHDVPLRELPRVLKRDLSLQKRTSAKQLVSLLKRIQRLQEELNVIGGETRP
jgi:site-specific recombinase XerD